MSRRDALVGALLVIMAGGLAAAGTVWADGVAPPAPSTARAVTVADAPTVTVCPGPPALADAAVEAAEAAEVTGPAFDPSPVSPVTSLRAVAAPGAPTLSGKVLAGSGESTVPLTAAGTVLDADGTVPVAVYAAPADDGPTALGALHTALTTDGDLRGLAATGCAAPATEGWLVGGGTSVGRSGRLVLANPGTTAGTVDLTVLTPGGPVQPSAGRGLVLAPGEQRALLLEGLVAGQDAVAVGFASRGAPVSALLVDTRLRGLTPAGAEVVAPTTAPAAHQVVPGLDVDERTALTVRVAVPGDAQAVVRWQLVGPDGPVVEGVEDGVATVAPGTVVDVRLPVVDPGLYSLVVEADVPVLAAVAVERGQTRAPTPDGDSGPVDIAWAAATAPLAGRSVTVLPDDDVSARLALWSGASSGAAVVELVHVAADGTPVASGRVSVEQATTAGVDLVGESGTSPLAVLVRPVTGNVHAATVLTASSGSSDDAGDDLVAVVGTSPAPVDAADVLVSTAPPGTWPGGR